MSWGAESMSALKSLFYSSLAMCCLSNCSPKKEGYTQGNNEQNVNDTYVVNLIYRTPEEADSFEKESIRIMIEGFLSDTAQPQLKSNKKQPAPRIGE
jgi:hypothetical protein